ncbi:hypothetical protein M413DRAFT_272630 [Hebeloma cylindrosporum]|uniref:Uncharacterized protein n=1 Tax=Hebeloma cylindrosporum TaxID=76867 RepID=A0A0C3CT93_HEBCY|nr:hypothetical protein M413DRAFT_272630 [Hebeloma cylindrosporum h7]
MAEKVQLYNDMIDRYSHPFFMVQLADLFFCSKPTPLPLTYIARPKRSYRVKASLTVTEILAKSREGPYYQTWKPTKQHAFPTSLPRLPSGSQEVKNQWQALASEGSTFFTAYPQKLAIETNHVESTFLLTEGSTQDLIRRGVSEGIVNYLPESSVTRRGSQNPGQGKTCSHT